MKKYELMYIIDPTVLEDARNALVEKTNELLKSYGANVLKAEKWGERKLAYPIEKKKTGFYVLTTFEIDGNELTTIEGKLNIMEEVMRYIIVKLN